MREARSQGRGSSELGRWRQTQLDLEMTLGWEAGLPSWSWRAGKEEERMRMCMHSCECVHVHVSKTAHCWTAHERQEQMEDGLVVPTHMGTGR